MSVDVSLSSSLMQPSCCYHQFCMLSQSSDLFTKIPPPHLATRVGSFSSSFQVCQEYNTQHLIIQLLTVNFNSYSVITFHISSVFTQLHISSILLASPDNVGPIIIGSFIAGPIKTNKVTQINQHHIRSFIYTSPDSR